jgi:hypothetical protein
MDGNGARAGFCGEVVLGEPGGAEVLEEELDLPGGPELQGQHLQAEGSLAAEGGPADAAEGGEAARETTVELGLLIGEAGASPGRPRGPLARQRRRSPHGSFLRGDRGQTRARTTSRFLP